MNLLNCNFDLKEEMIDYDEIDVDSRDRYFIPLDLSKIPKGTIDNFCGSDLISEVYISVFGDTKNMELVLCDIFGQTCVEIWNPKEEDIAIIEKIMDTIW